MKYIDADRLREELQKPKTELKVGNYYLDNSEQAVGYENALIDFELLIDSLQQEQDIIIINKKEWETQEEFRKNKDFGKSLQQEQPDFPITDEQIKEFLATHPKIKVPEKYKNPDWLLNKQEQPEVDLDELINDFLLNNSEFLIKSDSKVVVQKLARHFYELGKRNARKEGTK